MKVNRLQKLGHIERMEEKLSVQISFTQGMEKKRPKGRPKLKWRDIHIRRLMKTWSKQLEIESQEKR